MGVDQVLIRLRKAKNMTQQQLATEIGMTTTSYQRYEQGVRTPTLDKLLLLADYYDVSLDYLVGRSDDPRRLP